MACAPQGDAISLSECVGGADAALFVIQQRISPGQDLIGVQGSCQRGGMAQALLPGALCGCGSRLQLLAMTEEELRIGGAVDRVELVG